MSSQLEPVVEAEVVRTTPEWAALIQEDLHRAVEGVIAAGQHLIEAKSQVAHGQWLPLLEQIGISHDYAKRLMTISRNPAMSNGGNCHHFPSAFRALAELARLDPADVDAAIESGDITPDMTIANAKDLVGEHPRTPKPAAAQPAPLNDAPPKPRRGPLPHDFYRARSDLERAVNRLDRLVNDDRFASNRDTIARENRPMLSIASDRLRNIIDTVLRDGT